MNERENKLHASLALQNWGVRGTWYMQPRVLGWQTSDQLPQAEGTGNTDTDYWKH